VIELAKLVAVVSLLIGAYLLGDSVSAVPSHHATGQQVSSHDETGLAGQAG